MSWFPDPQSLESAASPATKRVLVLRGELCSPGLLRLARIARRSLVGLRPGFWPAGPVEQCTSLTSYAIRRSRPGALLGESEETLGALAPIPEHRVAPGALSRCEVGIENRTLLIPLRPLGTSHLTNDQSTRRDLLLDVLELRPAVLGCSFLHSPHFQSLVAEVAGAVITPNEACAVRGQLRPLGSA